MSEDTLWTFALRLWRRADVERQCLRLQDEYQVPVAAVLAALWLSRRPSPADAALGRRLLARAETMEKDYLRPLREVRRRAAAESWARELKRQIQEAELEAERLLLNQLADLTQGAPPTDQPVSMLSWLLMVAPEAGVCQGLQATLEALCEAVEESQ
ncbi:TIGR02444 family protein [Alcanivorax sp. 24]|uniref:TIGR02444 family protein n=1 Tax=Alcanivorax sp. 24 TaxID=2545266 RepID=UPI00105E0132|nr:TIGR02444 family protein [Alcanivorax sp. 24]